MTSTVLITGANRGIGLALARVFHGRGWRVIGTCRADDAQTDELKAVAGQVVAGIDVTRAEDVARLVRELGDQRLDLLINNAGLLREESLGELDFDSLREQMEVNAYAPLRVTEALLDHLGDGSKVINITSRMGSIADNGSGGYYGYRASKAALNALGRSLAMDLKPRGIAVAQLHPGMVSTRMINFAGQISPEDSAAGLVERIDALTLENTGSFWHCNGEELPW